MKVYIEFTAARDAFVLLEDRNSSNSPAFPLTFKSVKQAVEYAKQMTWEVVDHGHFDMGLDK